MNPQGAPSKGGHRIYLNNNQISSKDSYNPSRNYVHLIMFNSSKTKENHIIALPYDALPPIRSASNVRCAVDREFVDIEAGGCVG